MKTRVTTLLVLALTAVALAACAPAAPQTTTNTQMPPAQTEPTPAGPTAEEPTMDNPLTGSWNLSDLDGAAPAPGDRTANLEFMADGRLGGSTGCNSYFGSFSVAGDSLTTGQLGSTKMACPDPLMSQEDAFLAILGTAASFTIADDTLTITAADGRTMAFTRA